jgi:hypothetical protein
MRQQIDEVEAARLGEGKLSQLQRILIILQPLLKAIKQLISCTPKPPSLLAVRSPYLSLLSGLISSTLWDIIPQSVRSAQQLF